MYMFIPNDCIEAYENGFTEGLQRRWRRIKLWLKGGKEKAKKVTKTKIIPAATAGASRGLLTAVQQETGMLPPTTIDFRPIQAPTFRKELQPYSNVTLRAIGEGLQQRIGLTTTEGLRSALTKQLAAIETELVARELL